LELAFARNPHRHPNNHRKAREYIRTALENSGREVETIDFEAVLPDKSEVRGQNILSQTAGTPKFLVVAHYDTVDLSPGADDNTSAVALALVLAAHCPHIAVLFPDLEEQDLLGSRHFVSSQRFVETPTLVLESVGYWSQEPDSQSVPGILPLVFPQQFEWLKQRQFRGDFWVILHLESQRESAQSLAASLESDSVLFGIPAQSLQSEEGRHLSDFGRSDHLAFWEKGRPCLMVTDSANFRNPNYHRPSDTLETLDLPQLERLCENLIHFLQ